MNFMQNATAMILFQILLLVAITINTVFAVERGSDSIPVNIPDNFALGIVSSIRIEEYALLKTVTVDLHIAHPHIGDLLVQLECPNGQIVILHNHKGGRKKNINAAYRIGECENSQVVGGWKLVLASYKNYFI